MATQRRRRTGAASVPPLSSSQSLPQLSADCNNTTTNASPKCRGEFCRVAPASLPGLYGAGHENNRDSEDDEVPDAAVANALMTISPDDGQRFKISNNNLLLAKAEMAFLTGQVTGDDVALEWQEADNLHRAELGRGNPNAYYKQVGVCRNCHRIYSDLAALRDAGFVRKSTERKNAWKTAEAAVNKSKTKTGAVKKAGDVRRSAETQAAPELEENEYDKLFLAELARQSASVDGNVFMTSRRSEHESARSESGLESSRRAPAGSLPAIAHIAKAPSFVPTKSTKSNEQSLATPSNQPGGHAPARDIVSTDWEKTVLQLRDDLALERRKAKGIEAQNQLLEKKVAQMQALMDDKEAEFRKRLLEVEMDAVGKKMHGGSRSHESKASSASDVSELIETIDALNYQLDLSKAESEKLRRELLQSHQAEVKRIHEKYQLEMETMRLSEHTAKEQTEAAINQMNQSQAEAQVAMTQAKYSRSALDDLSKTKLPLLEEKNQRLERQLAELKTKLATSQPTNPSTSSDSGAIEKHLNNKIEYLKAQLASEMKCKEELGTHLAQITASVESLKKDKRTALQELDEAHKRHIERLESNFAQEKEVLCAQHASFQGKIATLQANVTDLVQELALWKSRDSNSKLAIEKMAEENVRLTRQIVDLEVSVETLQEEQQRDGKNGFISAKNASEETQRMQMEALLRRLDNERQYLKSQVDNELDQKAQAQKRVLELTDELQELKRTNEEMTKLAEHTISTLTAEKSMIERQLREEKATIEEKQAMISRQFKDLQVKFMQSREQALVDRDDLDKARIEEQEARSQLIAAREEVVKEKQYAKSASERMSKALATIKGSLKAMEEDKNRQIERLEGEAAMYMQKLANAQAELLVLETKVAEDKKQVRRQQALAGVLSLIDRKLTVRHAASKARAFWSLRSEVVMVAAIKERKVNHQAQMQELERSFHLETDEKWAQMKETYEKKHAETILRMTEMHNQEKDELQQYYDQEKCQLDEELRHLHACQMRELEEQYDQTLKAVDVQSAASVMAIQTRCEILEHERDKAQRAFEEARRKHEELVQHSEHREAAYHEKIQELEDAWKTEKESAVAVQENLNERARIELEKLEQALKAEQQRNITEIKDAAKKQQDATLERLRIELEETAAQRERQLLNEHAEELDRLAEAHAVAMDEEKETLHANWQQEFERQRLVHEKTLREALERVESKTQSHLNGLQKEMNDRKSQALLHTTAKWQNAMDELQVRLEVEKKVAYDAGVQDRENEWQQAALQIKQKQKEELEGVQNEAVRAIKAAEERHQLLLQAQLAQLRKEFEGKHKIELERLQDEIMRAEKSKHEALMEAALSKQAELLEQKYLSEMQNVRDELNDDHRADTMRLEDQFGKEKKLLLAEFQIKLDALQESFARDQEEKIAAMTTAHGAELNATLTDQRQQLIEEFERKREDQEEFFAQELEAKLKEQEDRLLNEQEEAINQVQEDSEKLIEQVEAAMSELKKQKEALENELTRLRTALEEAEDGHFDAEGQWKKQQKAVVFQLLSLIMHAKRKEKTTMTAHSRELEELQVKCDELVVMMRKEKEKCVQDIAQIAQAWGVIQSRHSEMLQTLTTYKRDELVAHRSAGSVLSNEIAIVVKQMEEVVEMKATLEKEIEQLQAEAQGVEANLRQLMLQSSSSLSNMAHASDSGMNMAVVSKKRRLNEEFDALLEEMEKKKSEVRNMDKTMASLRQRREEKEGELKKMERKLVEILVGQQKQVLAQLNATRELPVPAPLLLNTTMAS